MFQVSYCNRLKCNVFFIGIRKVKGLGGQGIEGFWGSKGKNSF
jgi:hypothetical protein